MPVAEGVYALVGETGPRSPESFGNNATFGVVVTEAGGDIIGAPQVDQSAFARLDGFDMVAGRNAQKLFAEMEWE